MRICIVYICAYIVFVCIGIYIHTHVHFLCGCNIGARRAFVPCNLRNPYSMFLIKNLYSCFLPYLCSRFALSVPLPFLCLVPLAVRFPKRLRGSFYSVFRAILSGLIVWRVHLHRLHRFVRLYSLICGKFAQFRAI